MFRRLEMIAQGMPPGYGFLPDPDAVKSAPCCRSRPGRCSRSPATSRLFTQAHYRASVDPDDTLSPLFACCCSTGRRSARDPRRNSTRRTRATRARRARDAAVEPDRAGRRGRRDRVRTGRGRHAPLPRDPRPSARAVDEAKRVAETMRPPTAGSSSQVGSRVWQAPRRHDHAGAGRAIQAALAPIPTLKEPAMAAHA